MNKSQDVKAKLMLVWPDGHQTNRVRSRLADRANAELMISESGETVLRGLPHAELSTFRGCTRDLVLDVRCACNAANLPVVIDGVWYNPNDPMVEE